MINLIYSWVQNLRLKEAHRDTEKYLVTEAHSLTQAQPFLLNRLEQERKSKNIEFSYFIGKPIILFERDKIVIGFVINTIELTEAKQLALNVYNSVDKNFYGIWDAPYIFTSHMFNLLDLSMKDILLLVNKNQKIKDTATFDKSEISKELVKNGFFSQLESYLNELKNKDINTLDSYERLILKDYDNLIILSEQSLLSSHISEKTTTKPLIKI